MGVLHFFKIVQMVPNRAKHQKVASNQVNILSKLLPENVKVEYAYI